MYCSRREWLLSGGKIFVIESADIELSLSLGFVCLFVCLSWWSAMSRPACGGGPALLTDGLGPLQFVFGGQRVALRVHGAAGVRVARLVASINRNQQYRERDKNRDHLRGGEKRLEVLWTELGAERESERDREHLRAARAAPGQPTSACAHKLAHWYTCSINRQSLKIISR